MQLMMHEGPIPKPERRGRAIYPFRTMNVGQFFFLPGRHRDKNFSSYLAHQGKRIGRKFSIRRFTMRKNPQGLWEIAKDGEPGAVQGIAVYRSE